MLKWEDTLMGALHMKVEKQTDKTVEVSMPVSSSTVQPFGYLHGGATVALAETAASIGSATIIDSSKEISFGAEISASHVRSVREGVVTAKATLQHKGRSSHVWLIDVVDEAGELVSACRCSVAVRPKRSE